MNTWYILARCTLRPCPALSWFGRSISTSVVGHLVKIDGIMNTDKSIRFWITMQNHLESNWLQWLHLSAQHWSKHKKRVPDRKTQSVTDCPPRARPQHYWSIMGSAWKNRKDSQQPYKSFESLSINLQNYFWRPLKGMTRTLSWET